MFDRHRASSSDRGFESVKKIVIQAAFVVFFGLFKNAPHRHRHQDDCRWGAILKILEKSQQNRPNPNFFTDSFHMQP